MLPEIIHFAAEQNQIRFGSLQGRTPRNPRAYVISRGRTDRIIIAVFNSFVIVFSGIFFIQSLSYHNGFLSLASAAMMGISGLLCIWLKMNPVWLFKVLIPSGLVNTILGMYIGVTMFNSMPVNLIVFGIIIFIALPTSAIMCLFVICLSQKEIYNANHAFRFPQCWPPEEYIEEELETEDEDEVVKNVLKERWENPDYDPMDDPLHM